MSNTQKDKYVQSAEVVAEEKRRAETVVSNRLCSTCQTLASGLSQYIEKKQNDFYEQQLPTKLIRYMNRQQRVHAARQGCHLCSVIGAYFEQGYQDECALERIREDLNPFLHSLAAQMRLGEADVVVAVTSDSDTNKLEVSFIEMRNEFLRPSLTAMCCQVFESEDINSGLEFDSSIMGLPVWSGSEQSSALVSGWFEECINHHSDCYVPPGSDSLYPNRLLDLGTDEGTSGIVLRDFSDGTRSPYMALSHCWGGVEPLKLTAKTYAEFLAGIEWNSIPQTFRDAVTITRRLSCRYLWIDSLCIIQDDRADWEREAPRMGDIYRYAICTLAALDAKNPYSGIFSFRNPLAYRPIAFNSASGESFRMGHNTVEADIDQFFQLNRSPSNRSPLLKRAWVLQERFLSQRILAYSSTTISWQCRELRISEHDLKRSPPVFHDHGMFHHMFIHGSNSGPDFNDLQSRAFIYGWHSIVEEYTKSIMTFPTDRSPGISGMINFIRRHTKLDITFGMWHKWMIEEITWIADTPGKRLENNAPTWSWMSSASPVRWIFLSPPLRNIDFVAEILSPTENNSNQENTRLILRAYIEKSNSLRHGFLDPSLDIDSEDLRPVWLLLVYFRKDSDKDRGPQAFGLLIQPTKDMQIEFDSDERTSWVQDKHTEWERVGTFYAGPEETVELWPLLTFGEDDKEVIHLV
jgi:hypothetical protein